MNGRVGVGVEEEEEVSEEEEDASEALSLALALSFAAVAFASLSIVTARGPLVQSMVRWTFCSSTHPPSFAAFATSLDATSSCP